MKSVTWQAPSGETIRICKACEKARGGHWVKNDMGEEFCLVHEGLSEGECDLCKPMPFSLGYGGAKRKELRLTMRVAKGCRWCGSLNVKLFDGRNLYCDSKCVEYEAAEE